MTSSARCVCVCVLSLSFQLRTVSLVYDDEPRLQPLENALLLLLLLGFLVMTSYLGIITWLLKVFFFLPLPSPCWCAPVHLKGPSQLEGMLQPSVEPSWKVLLCIISSLTFNLFTVVCMQLERETFFKWISSLQWLWITWRILISNFFSFFLLFFCFYLDWDGRKNCSGVTEI